MATYEEANASAELMGRINSELNHLMGLLEADPYWQNRAVLFAAEPEQVQRLEQALERLREILQSNQRAVDAWAKSAPARERLQAMGQLDAEEWGPVYAGMKAEATGAAEGSGEIRDVMRLTINHFRAHRGEPPLDGSESTAN